MISNTENTYNYFNKFKSEELEKMLRKALDLKGDRELIIQISMELNKRIKKQFKNNS